MTDLVLIKNNTAVCSTLQVSEKFHKRHKNVMRSIDDMIKSDSAQNWAQYFKKTSYKDASGKSNKMYYMNRDGFSLLVMGFTGKEALHWKLQYIQAFNKMEQLLIEKQTTLWQNTRLESKINRLKETDEIKELVAYAKENGSKNADKYYITFSKLANKAVGLDSSQRNHATTSQLNNLILIENIISYVIKEGLQEKTYYKAIYQCCKERIEQFKYIAYLGKTA